MARRTDSVLDDIAPRLLRLGIVLAAGSSLAFFAGSQVAASARPWSALALVCAAVAAVGTLTLLTNSDDPRPMLVTAALGTAATPILTDVPIDRQLVAGPIVIVGIVLGLFVRTHVRAFIAGYAAFLVATELAWHGIADPRGLALGVGQVAAFAFGTVAVWELRKRLETNAARFGTLFDRAPIPLFEEDFRAVRDRLAVLRRRGVTDIRGYLDAHPEELLSLAGSIRITGMNAQAAATIRSRDREVLVPESEGALRSLVEQIVAIWGGADRVVVRLDDAIRADGTRFDALVYWSAPVVDGKADLEHVTVAIADVSDQRAAQRDLEDAVRARDEFVATVSHELRTPLTVVLGLAEELQERHEEFTGPERGELVSMIADQSRELAAIVEDLLVVARAGAGGLTVTCGPVDLVAETAAVLTGRAPVPVSTDRPAKAWADPGRVRQIIRNLLQNAHRYGGPEVRIVIDGTCLEVRDNGGPIPDDIRDTMFDPYVKARQRTGVTGSMGLGLSVSRHLARAMGGDVTYRHDGTEGVFRLRLHPEPEPG